MFFAAQEPLAAKLQFIEEIPLLMMSDMHYHSKTFYAHHDPIEIILIWWYGVQAICCGK